MHNKRIDWAWREDICALKKVFLATPHLILLSRIFMDGSGFPLAFSTMPGSSNEQPTLKPLEKRILKEWALNPEGWQLPGRKQEINLDDIRHFENDRRTYYKERWIKENDLEQKLIVTYPPVYKRYQSSVREHQIDRAIKKIENPGALNEPRQNDPKRFIIILLK